MPRVRYASCISSRLRLLFSPFAVDLSRSSKLLAGRLRLSNVWLPRAVDLHSVQLRLFPRAPSPAFGPAFSVEHPYVRRYVRFARSSLMMASPGSGRMIDAETAVRPFAGRASTKTPNSVSQYSHADRRFSAPFSRLRSHTWFFTNANDCECRPLILHVCSFNNAAADPALLA